MVYIHGVSHRIDHGSVSTFLIVSNGVKVFWPDETAVIKLKEGSKDLINNSPTSQEIF